jgi:hypothetical protein
MFCTEGGRAKQITLQAIFLHPSHPAPGPPHSHALGLLFWGKKAHSCCAVRRLPLSLFADDRAPGAPKCTGLLRAVRKKANALPPSARYLPYFGTPPGAPAPRRGARARKKSTQRVLCFAAFSPDPPHWSSPRPPTSITQQTRTHATKYTSIYTYFFMLDQYNASQVLAPGQHPKAFSHSGASRFWVSMAVGESFVLDTQSGTTFSLLVQGDVSQLAVEVSNHDYRQPDASKTNGYAKDSSQQYVQPNPDTVWHNLGSPDSNWTKLDIAGIGQVRLTASGAIVVHAEVTALASGSQDWVGQGSSDAAYSIVSQQMCSYDPIAHTNTPFVQVLAVDPTTGDQTVLSQHKDSVPFTPTGIVKNFPLRIGQEQYLDVTQTNLRLLHNVNIQATSVVQNQDLSWSIALQAVQMAPNASLFGAFSVIDRNAGSSVPFVSTGLLMGHFTALPGQRLLINLLNFSQAAGIHTNQGFVEVLADGTLQMYFPKPQLHGDGLDRAYAYDVTIYTGTTDVSTSWEPQNRNSTTAIGGQSPVYSPFSGGVAHQYTNPVGNILSAFYYGENWPQTTGTWAYEIRHDITYTFV